MKFCSLCGSTVTSKIPDGDNRLRYVCDTCDEIHYQNPKIVTGTIPVWDNKVLLCKRAIEPRYGLWTLPAGFMENAETCQAGAIRETQEEAHADVDINHLYTTFNLPRISQVYMLFLAQLKNLDFHAGIESLDVALFKEDDIPWDDLAFPVVNETLKLYFSDFKKHNNHKQQTFPHRTGDIEWTSKERREYSISLL